MDGGVEAAGDGAVDDGLLLLLQQLDQLLLGADVASDAPVRVVEEADDGGLFGEGWKWGTRLRDPTQSNRKSCRTCCLWRAPADPTHDSAPSPTTRRKDECTATAELAWPREYTGGNPFHPSPSDTKAAPGPRIMA